MKKIWKFPLSIVDEISINMPKGAEILSVQVQKNNPCIWALVDPYAEVVKRNFSIFGTGHAIIEDNYIFIGTFQLYNGDLVLHLFEEI